MVGPARYLDAVARAYATAPSAVAEAAAAAARAAPPEDRRHPQIRGSAHFTRRTFTGGRRRSRKKGTASHADVTVVAGAQAYLIFQRYAKKKQTRKEKEEREERNKDAIAEQRFKLRLAAAAGQDYLASTKQEGIPNIERMAKCAQHLGQRGNIL